jgi:hypothetical protein
MARSTPRTLGFLARAARADVAPVSVLSFQALARPSTWPRAMLDQDIERRLDVLRRAHDWPTASFDLSGFSYPELIAIAEIPLGALMHQDTVKLSVLERELARRLTGTMAEVSSADDRSEMADYRIPRAGAARSPHYATNMGGRA